MNRTESIAPHAERSWDADGKGLVWEGRDEGSLWLAFKAPGAGLSGAMSGGFFCVPPSFLQPWPLFARLQRKTHPESPEPAVNASSLRVGRG